MDKKTFSLSTAIDYPSSKPHCGHMYEKVLADVIARWHRLQGEKVHFSTGLDEHGLKIQRAAEKQGLSPQQFVDRMKVPFLELCKVYNIGYDDFIRTTEKRHEGVVKEILMLMHKKGFIYKGSYQGTYCVECETFYTEKDLVDGKCPTHKKPAELFTEEGYFFKMGDFQSQLIAYIQENPSFIHTDKKRKEILNRLKEPLKDLSITRKGVWGLEFPLDKQYTIAVWTEALINYLTTLDYPQGKFKDFWPSVHIIGPDIIWHHTVIWGAMLMACGLPLPKVVTHGYINLKGEKMSKSLGNVIDPLELAKRYPTDAIRYFLLRDIPFGEDGDFSESGLKARYNNELANDLGNLVSRILSLAEKHFDGRIKKHPVDKKLSEKLDLKKISEHMDNLELHLALFEIMGFVKHCNKHVNDEKLWEKKGKELELHLYSLLEALRIIAIVLQPFIPESVGKINKQLGIQQGLLKGCKFGLMKSYNVKKEGILFQKVDADEKVPRYQISSFAIEPPLKKQGVNVCMALISNIAISNKNHKIEELKKEVAQEILAGGIKNKDVLDGYREFYRRAGLDCTPAAENLITLIQKNKNLPNINNVVDCYNAVSAETGLSFGAHDADKVGGKLRFKTTLGDEKFIPLGEKLPVKINKGEYAFMDDKEVLCRMDIKQCEKTKITKNTKNVIIYAQGNRNVKESYLKEAIVKVCGTLKNIYGCEYSILKEV